MMLYRILKIIWTKIYYLKKKNIISRQWGLVPNLVEAYKL